MRKKRRIFLFALGVFLLLMAGAMLLDLGTETYKKKNPEKTTPQHMAETVRKIQQPGERFESFLPFKPGDKDASTPAWTHGAVRGVPAWKDNRTGLVWGPKLEGLELKTHTPADLDRARAACAAQEPAGSWALPTADEFDHMRGQKLPEMDKENASYRWITYRPSTYVLTPMLRGWGKAAMAKTYHVRCVGRARVKG